MDIGEKAFDGCRGLLSIIVEEGNTKYDSRNGCNAIIETASNTLIKGCKNTVIPESITTIGYRGFASVDIVSIDLPNSLTTISSYAFYECTKLSTVAIPEGVTSIGDGAFNSCYDLKAVTIPESVTDIGEHAFLGCSLIFVRGEGAAPIDIYANTFPNCKDATLYVPVGCKAAYEAADYWNDFKMIKEFPNPDVNQDDEVDVVDVVDIARFVIGTPSGTFEEFLADLNEDGAINLGDAVVLVNNIAGEQNFVKGLSVPESVSVNDALMLAEANGSVSLCLDNERYYTAFQFDLYVPENADVSKMMLNGERSQQHQLLYNKVEEGHYRVAALSTSNNEFNGNDGELLNIALSGVAGDEVSVRNIHFFDAKGQDYRFEDIEGANATAISRPSSVPFFYGEEIFDLQGRKRSMLQRGVNIVGGKKVIVK